VKRLLFLAALLSGCAAPPRVETTTTTFHGPGHEARGTIAVRTADASADQSLEFRSYKPRIEQRLAAAGYTIAAGRAEYVALVSYSVDAGTRAQVTLPIYGQTGGGTSYSFGTVQGADGPKPYSGTTYNAPTYGVVGATTQSVVVYTRTIAIDIVDAVTRDKRYEMRARSAGRCGAIVEVFDAMLEAMFDAFPGENGRARSTRVAVEVEC
jgi:hypothetical protein